MSATLIAERYAKGLSAAVTDTAELDGMLEGLRAFAAGFEGSPEMRAILQNPAMSIADRAATLGEIANAAGFDTLTTNFLDLLLRRGRLDLIGLVVRTFGDVVDERLGRMTATVVSVAPLEPEAADRVRTSLETYSGKQVRLETATDPEILGGLVVRLDGIVIDGSLRARLEQLKQHLLSKEN